MNFKDLLLTTLLGVFVLIPSAWASEDMGGGDGGAGGGEGGENGGGGE